ncbi:Imidazole glycerol phosphate synthase subunit HisF [Bifidobacterium magnum]|uniref:imidazole glycerol-phosphate synthase n=1 Tax=Bifidobacterium magnum TaxID=1692 RepID=A0A087BA62_9BIFI|nr:Imidazole glycerol phosphate synthase subunit HisF [Bifidobacterium magnum]
MSLAVRVIPCLDVNDGRVVKGVHFEHLKDAGDPVQLAAEYYRQGADELTFLDVTASSSHRQTMVDVVGRTADQIFIPLTVGGGVRSVEDVDSLLRCGADKVSLNTAAIRDPELIARIADRFGNQVVVLSVDARRQRGEVHTPSGFEVTVMGGRKSTGIDALWWAKRAEELGAGGGAAQFDGCGWYAGGFRFGDDRGDAFRGVHSDYCVWWRGQGGGFSSGDCGGCGRGVGGFHFPLREGVDWGSEGCDSRGRLYGALTWAAWLIGVMVWRILSMTMVWCWIRVLRRV